MSGERVVVIDEPEYIASYHEEDLGEGRIMTFVHLDVYYMSASILRQLKKQWDLWRHYVSTVLFCMGEEDDEKFERFVSKFGFKYLRDVPCTDNKTRRLYVNFGPAPKEAQEQ
jgi:predicted solute-binding protein